MYGGFGFDGSRIPNLMELLAFMHGGMPFNGNPGMIPQPGLINRGMFGPPSPSVAPMIPGQPWQLPANRQGGSVGGMFGPTPPLMPPSPAGLPPITPANPNSPYHTNVSDGGYQAGQTVTPGSGYNLPPITPASPNSPYHNGYTTLPAQRPALQPQQIQGILQRWGQSSY